MEVILWMVDMTSGSSWRSGMYWVRKRSWRNMIALLLMNLMSLFILETKSFTRRWWDHSSWIRLRRDQLIICCLKIRNMWLKFLMEMDLNTWILSKPHCWYWYCLNKIKNKPKPLLILLQIKANSTSLTVRFTKVYLKLCWNLKPKMIFLSQSLKIKNKKNWFKKKMSAILMQNLTSQWHWKVVPKWNLLVHHLEPLIN